MNGAVSYQDFYCGLTFAEVRQELAVEVRNVFEREGRRMFVTRHTVLGRMRQHKLAAWDARQKMRIEEAP